MNINRNRNQLRMERTAKFPVILKSIFKLSIIGIGECRYENNGNIRSFGCNYNADFPRICVCCICQT